MGGPQEPAILHSVDRLAPVAELLDVDRLEQVRRQTPAGTALDTLLWGRRTGPDRASPAVACRHDGHGGRRRARGRAPRRRRLVAMVIVFAMVLAAGATVLSILLS